MGNTKQLFLPLLLVALCLLGASCASDSSGQSLPGGQSPKAEIVEAQCPTILNSANKTLDTAEGEFTLDKVEAWIGPNCENDGGDHEEKGFMIYYRWTNTTPEPVTLGATKGPLEPLLILGGQVGEFLSPPTPQGEMAYRTVAPGDSADFQEWHRCVSCKVLPDAIRIQSWISDPYGDIPISVSTD